MTIGQLMLKPVTLWEKGQVISGLKVRDNVVYIETSGDIHLPIGKLLKEDYSWTEDVKVPNMDDTTLVVLDFHNEDGWILFGYKHLIPRDEAIKSFFESLIEEKREEVFEAWLESKRPRNQANHWDGDNSYLGD